MNNRRVSESRRPAKRKVTPVESSSLLDLNLVEGESSDDSDFRIEDHPEESDDYSINTDDDKKKHGSSESSEGESDEDEYKTSSHKMGEEMSVNDILERAKMQDFKFPGELANMLICAGCLGSRSDDFNEIVECDGCGVTVHEGCYGVCDVSSESSTVSSASTEPWFCEACKAGVSDPGCELCPNKGGIFKETEVGAWVHLVCALYVPGVAFSEVERLSGVTLFEMAYSRWGARACALCPDAVVARTGVSIGCDAGLCKTFFHVTCGQREGLLAEAHTEEVEQADPFYAHCRLHSDKQLINKRKKNWLALQLRTTKRKVELASNMSADERVRARIHRKLIKYKRKYKQQKENRNPPWVPTQKMARMLYSSASAVRRFQRKAECMGVDVHALEFQHAQIAALKDVSRRWHVPPAFSVEFVGYYLERNSRVTSLRHSLERLAKENDKLLAEDEALRDDYDAASAENSTALAELSSTRQSVQRLYDAVLTVGPAHTPRPAVLDDTPVMAAVAVQRSTPKVTPQQLHKRSLAVPTAAALKMGVGFPLSDNPDARQGKVLSTSLEATTGALANRQCAVCARSSERHLMAACDTCKGHYHLHCLRPPLQRPPKKGKLYGWQCSECDKTSDSEPEVLEKKVPRRSRIRYSKDGAIIAEGASDTNTTPPKHKPDLPLDAHAHAHKHKADLSVDAHKHAHNKPHTSAVENKPDASHHIKVTIKPFDALLTSDADDEHKDKDNKDKDKKRDKKIKKKLKESDDKRLKRSFTSPALTNTPLMSITPLVADSPNDSHNEMSDASQVPQEGSSSRNHSFTSLLSQSEPRDSKSIESSIESTLANLSSDIATYKANRKRRKEKHRSRYSPDLLRSQYKHKHKRKKKLQDRESPYPHPRITIKIKPIPKPDGSLDTDTQMFYVPTAANHGMPPDPGASAAGPAGGPAAGDDNKHTKQTVAPTEVSPTNAASTYNARGRSGRGLLPPAPAAGPSLAPLTHCDVCTQTGDNNNLVRCDECNRRYHFSCLEPPLARNPKKRGYSWHCADCDPTDKEDNH